MPSDDTTHDLQDLLGRIRRGEPEAVNAFLARAAERLRRLAGRVLGDFARARREWETDDALAAAYARLVRSLRDKLTPDTPHDFFQIAAQQIRYELLDLLRKVGRRGPAAPLGGAAEPAADTTAVPVKVGRAEESRRLWEGVESLDPEHREAIDLRYSLGWSFEQIAAHLGVGKETARRRCVAAELALRRRLRSPHSE
jgi:RNA polymerase sigma-70 factor (ECF subfamily)